MNKGGGLHIFILGIFAFYLVFIFIVWLLDIVAKWKIFSKAGMSGWMAIIPILNQYIDFKISWKKAYLFWIATIITIIVVIGNKFADGMLFSFILILLGLIALIISIIASFKKAKAFGHSALFGIGLLLIPTIFNLILAFDSSEYIGPQD